MRRRTRASRFWIGLSVTLLMLVLFAVGAIAGMVAAYARNLPDISRMADYQPASTTRIFARDGTQLAAVYKENRVWVPIGHIPAVVRDAFIANEDHNFYYHHGVDFSGIIRAAFADLTHQQLQGASTITQQLARRLFLTDRVSMARKVQEGLLAIEIERYYTKDEILERYLNIIYLGAGAYGVDAAAHTYFGRGVEQLTLAQSAMLAGIVAAPSVYSPFSNLTLARDRQRHVLDRMVESGYVTSAQADAAYDGPLGLIAEKPPGLQGYRFPYFTTYAIAQLQHLFGKNAVEEGGMQVYTTLDRHMQDLAQESVTWGVSQAIAEGIGAHQAALVALRPSTGEILAMVGGAGFSLRNQFNRAWQARRQPGSSFKIYDYTAAIDSGMPASTIIDDSPVSYPMGDGTQWSPLDDDHSYMGAMTLREALVYSRNIVAVKLADRVGLDRVIDYAHRMGVTSPLEANLSLALGSSVLTVLDQASGYSTLADQGLHLDPTPFRLVRDSLGSVVLDNRFPQATDVVSAGAAYIMTSIFEDVIKRGTGYPNAVIGRPAAGKTGTTSDFRDAWFVGYTPDLVTAVWLGNDDYTPMNESYGGNIPARIWARFMKAALAHTPPHDFPFPSDEVAKISGCGHGTEYYLKGTEGATCGSSMNAYDAANAAAQSAAAAAAAAALPQPTVPPPDATPPLIPPTPVPSPEESVSPTPAP